MRNEDEPMTDATVIAAKAIALENVSTFLSGAHDANNAGHTTLAHTRARAAICWIRTFSETADGHPPRWLLMEAGKRLKAGEALNENFINEKTEELKSVLGFYWGLPELVGTHTLILASYHVADFIMRTTVSREFVEFI